MITEVSRTTSARRSSIVTHDIREAIRLADTLWLIGRERTLTGDVLEGARIVGATT